MPPWVSQPTSLGVVAPTEDEDYPLGFGPADPIVNATLLSTMPWGDHLVMVSDTLAARCLENFTKRVL